MLCQKCGKNPATTHIKTVVNGVMDEINLCSHCAETANYSPFKNNLIDMLASVFGDADTTLLESNTKCCECCKSTFREIAATGKMGCAECYKTFKNELLPYIKRIHSTTNHIGKKPNTAVMVVDKTTEISKLRERLNELIKNEKFEEAAVLRDEIKRVQEGTE
jgi:protein arginine kinase activator